MTLDIPIKHIEKTRLAREVRSQLPDDIGPDSPYWPFQLLVLVMKGNDVLYAGNFAESADLAGLRYDDAVMDPPAHPVADDPVFDTADPYTRYFLAHLNLEYFVAVAAGEREPYPPAIPVDLGSPRPVPLARHNLVLWGSAGNPLENALFIPMRMREIRDAVQDAVRGQMQTLVLFGGGPEGQANDTSYIDEAGHTRFKRVDVGADMDASGASLNRVLTSVRLDGRAHTLLVQVGHSGTVGSPLWGSLLTLSPDDLDGVTASGGDLVMVSGACHSGLFARAPRCGFFAAHPEVLAVGCQLSPDAIENSDDYLREFFHAATTPDKDGKLPTMLAAHWYASTHIEPHEISYLTTDAIIDDWFDAHPDRLPETIQVSDFERLMPYLDDAARTAAALLVDGLDGGSIINLENDVRQNQAADDTLADATEASSRERRAMLSLPYPLMLPSMARRAIYLSQHPHDPAFDQANRCEARSLQDLLEDPANATPD